MSFIHENMARIILRSRQLLVASVILLLVGVVVLSAATHRPCLRVRSGSWHTSKAGHMTIQEGHDTGKMPLLVEGQTPEVIPSELHVIFPTFISHEKDALPGISVVVQIRNFRAPPTCG